MNVLALVALAAVGLYLYHQSRVTAPPAVAASTTVSDILRSSQALAGTGLDHAVADILRPTDLPSGTASANQTAATVPGPTASETQTDYLVRQVDPSVLGGPVLWL
jgi:hypothetical protein